jgi:glycosyltransferase involved in cell wall biosynthesis
MRIVYFLTSPEEYKSGVWFYRNVVPARILREIGHEVKMVVLVDKIDESWYSYPDVAVFKGMYNVDPIPLIRKLKQNKKRVVYDIDDDFEAVNPDNPALSAVKKRMDFVRLMLKEADIITTTTEILRDRLQKYNKNIYICPNALDFTEFRERDKKSDILKIGYSGGATHWFDLEIVVDVLLELQKKHQFKFILQGMTGQPLIAEMYGYQYYLTHGFVPEKKEYFISALRTFEKLKRLDYLHIPWYPPILYPEILRGLDLDIGICPLHDNRFNQAKSCIKFYEFSSTGSAVLASNVLPYKKEVNYLAKNKFKDWYNKLERLIIDKEFREKTAEKQWEWVEKNRNIREVIKNWENAFGLI